MQTIDKIQVGIIENSRMLRESLMASIKSERDMSVAFSCSVVMWDFVNHKADVILLQWEELNDWWVQGKRESPNDGRLIIMNADFDKLNVVQCIQSGVAGFTLKDSPFEDIANAIRSVAAGNWAIPSSITFRLFNQLAVGMEVETMDPAMVLNRITNRERQIIPLITEGLSNKEIAQKLNIATDTVKTHVHNILGKSNCQKRIQLVCFSRNGHHSFA
jgi:DNA-binding NarL/FixJ family response regulator